MNYVVLDFEVKDKSNLVEDGVFKKIYKRDFGFDGIKLNQVITENILSIKLLDLEKNQVIRITEKDKTMIDTFFEKGWEWYNYLGITHLESYNYKRHYIEYVIYIRRVDKLPNIYMGYDKERNVYLLADYGREASYNSINICKEFIENNKELFKTIPCYYMEVDKLQQVFNLNQYKNSLKAKLLGKFNISFVRFCMNVNSYEIDDSEYEIVFDFIFTKGCEELVNDFLCRHIEMQGLDINTVENDAYGDLHMDENLIPFTYYIFIKKEIVDRLFSKSNVYDAYRHYDESIDRLIEFK